MSESNHKLLWEKCLEKIKDNVSEQAFLAWFSPIESLGFDGNIVELRVPSQFFIEKFESSYSNLLRAVLRSVYGESFRLRYSVQVVNNLPDTNVTIDSPKNSTLISNKYQKQFQGPGSPFEKIHYPDLDSQLNPKYTLENYCGSFSNKLALSIGETIATNPDCKTFNPLLVFGPTGVGKTHLIQGIGIKIKEKYPNKRVLYLTSRIFESQYTTAVARNKVNDFINFYQSIDVLLMDDIQEFAGKQSTQNTFYHIFNHLHQNQKQLILSSDCPPVSLDGIVPRLMSRFKWGVTAELYSPDFELRRKVLDKKAHEDGLPIPQEVIDYIANSVTDGVRELEGIIVSLITRATIMNQVITVDLAKSVIANTVKVNKKQLTIDFIVETVASHYNINSDLIYGKSRKRQVSDPRQIVMYLAKKHTSLSSTTIGLKLSRDHATVLYAEKAIKDRLPNEKQLQLDIEEIENEFKK